MRGVAILVVVGVCASAAARSDAVAEARRAIQQLRYEDARPLIEAALARGHHARGVLLDLYELRAEVAAVLEGADAGEAQFRRLLVLAPEHAPPPRDTPVFTVPFARAQKWVAARGALEVKAQPAGVVTAETVTPVALVIANDPFAQVAAARLYVRREGEEGFAAQAERSLQPRLPALRAGSVAGYYVEVLDRADNVVAEVGSARAPLRVEVTARAVATARPQMAPRMASEPPAPVHAGGGIDAGAATEPEPVATATQPPPPAPARTGTPTSHLAASWTLASVGLAALGGAIGSDVASRNDYDQLLRDCAPDCARAPNYDRYTRERTAALTLYPIAAVSLTTAAILFIYDGVRYRKR